MSVSPNALTHTSTALFGSYEWRYYDTTTTHYRYGMYHITNGAFFDVPTSLIKVGKSGQSDYNTWSDANTTANPNQVVDNNTGNVSLNYSGTSYSFVKPTVATWISSGPTVTSHTAGIVITNDTIADTDFTWLKDGSTYSPTNLTLTASSTIGPNNDTGYYYDDFENTTAIYTTTIDSKAVSALYVDIGWTIGNTASSGRTTNSNRILNVLATIPSYITIGSGSDLNGNPNPLTTVFSYNARVIQHTQTATIDGVTGNIYINFVINNKVIDGVSEIVATFYETRTIGTDSSHQSNSVDYIIGAQQTMTYNQSLNGDTITYYVSDWVYSNQPEGDGYVAPVSTPSDGGRKRRYPIISTNLFDRQRSIYSIGITHKDETLF